MRVRFARILGLGAALWLSALAPASAARIALVIGNDTYEHLPKLQKAVGDARAMKAALERLGFAVTYGENLGFKDFARTVAGFQGRVAAGDEVVVHYSGHGVQMNGRNYLLPVDMEEPELGQESLVSTFGRDAGELVEGLRSRGPALVFAVLDACRNNPFEGASRAMAGTRGLARMEAEPGAFILFSAGPGETALDRLGDNDIEPTSVFTRVLLKNLEKPGLSLQRLAKATQGEVSSLAKTVGHTQFPDYFDRTVDEPVLKPGPVSADDGDAGKGDAVATLPRTDPEEALLREAAAECDRLAASPVDPDKPASVAGVASNAVNGMAAEPVCRRAAEGLPKERRLAFQWARALQILGRNEDAAAAYSRAADAGSVAAINNLASLYEAGLGVPKDEARALELINRAVDQNFHFSIMLLGLKYQAGALGLPKDEQKAFELYMRAADLGNTNAINQIASIYLGGLYGQPKDEAKALAYYQRGADLGDGAALYGLGFMYATGKGTAADRAKAIEYFRKASILGNALAARGLRDLGEPPVAVPAADVAPCDAVALGGAWANKDPKTRSVTRIEISVACVGDTPTYAVEAWGSCHPEDCAWGKTAGQWQAEASAIKTTFADGNFRDEIVVTMGDSDELAAMITDLGNGSVVNETFVRTGKTLASLGVPKRKDPPGRAVLPRPAAVACDKAKLVGAWRNIDDGTRGTTQVLITAACKGGKPVYTLKMWGKCHPTDCEQDARAVPFSASKGELKDEYDLGWGKNVGTVSIGPGGRLQSKGLFDFSEKDGRKDYTYSYFFERITD